jgi:alpha-tubulin suppressor-like RCC1 family protein
LPVEIAGGIRFATIASGASARRTCGIDAGGTSYCWSGLAAPTSIVGAPILASLTVGGRHVCGLTAAGAAFCWGENGLGQLGIGSFTVVPVTEPTAVVGGLVFAELSAGAGHTCGVTPAGAMYCWGSGSGGRLGDGEESSRAQPTLVTPDRLAH